MASARVSIISDDRIFCDGLRRILSADGSLASIQLPERPPATSADIRAAGLGVLLSDARMHGAIDLCRRLKQEGGPPVLFIAVADDETWAVSALAAGGRGIILKSAPPEDVSKAIHVILKGGIWAPRPVIVAAWLKETRERSSDASPILDPRLTPREMEVLRHAAAGLGNREVAFALAISEATVKAHLTSIFQKLGLRGRARLAAAYHGIANPTTAHSAPDRARRPA
jgi:DNA-binding NarL/FixJ family response regulator